MVYFLLILMVLAWAANFIVAKWALEELPPFSLLFLRVLMSNALFLALYFSLRRPRQPGASAPNRPADLRAGWPWFALLGLFGIAGNQTGFTVGIHYTTVAHSALIISLTPILVLILAVRMRLESLTLLKVLGMGLSFTGVAILVSEHGFGSDSPTFHGDLITLGGSAAFALYTVYGKRIADRYDTLTFNTFTYLAGGLFIVPIAGWQLFRTDWQQVSWQGWLGAAYMAGIASVAAYLIFYYALSKLSATRVITFTYLQPVLATLLAVAFLGEQPTKHVVLGGTLVLVGVYLAERARG
ncbi:MAG: EamA family transporter [Acidobacteria bacterium]|nr:EamA family transporter [Acidobacteriota bacterium]